MSGDSAQMIDAEAMAWVVRIDRGLSPAELDALDAWLMADMRRRGALVRAQAGWSLLDQARALGAGEEADATLPAHRVRRHLASFAAGIALILATGVTWQLIPRGERIATTTGEVRRLPLEDGSLAVINSASGVRVSYSRDRRDVELSRGEAWFKVAKNRSRPFTVAAGPTRVQAVGTAFDVRRHSGYSEVTVSEGTVKIWSASNGPEPILVSADHRVRIGDRKGIVVEPLSATEVDKQLAWREGRIVIDAMTLEQAADEFNRYNGLQLTIDPIFASERMIGWFRFDDVEGFVRASATLVGGKVERQGGKIRIAKKFDNS